MKEIILDELAKAGFKVTELGDTCYGFEYEDLVYFYLVDEDETDDNYLRIVLPNILDVTEENYYEVLKAMNKASEYTKYTQLHIVNDQSLWVVYEHYLSSTDDVATILEHMIQTLFVSFVVFKCTFDGKDFHEYFSAMKHNRENELPDMSEEELEEALRAALGEMDIKDESDE